MIARVAWAVKGGEGGAFGCEDLRVRNGLLGGSGGVFVDEGRGALKEEIRDTGNVVGVAVGEEGVSYGGIFGGEDGGEVLGPGGVAFAGVN